MKRFNVTVNGKAYDVAVEEIGAGVPAPVAAAPAPAPAAPVAVPAAAAPVSAAPAGASGTVVSPMPGNILDIKVSVGQVVEVNQVVVVLEAMKMENDIVTPAAGTISGIHVSKGDSVETGTLMISIA